MSKTGAAFNRAGSKQDYSTPAEFIAAVEKLYGLIAYDLAATAGNAKAELFITPEEDSFTVAWHRLSHRLLWLNPPFANIAPWAKKCRAEALLGAHIALLVPAAVGSVWFADYVEPYAVARPLRPRLSFDGKHPYPKDCMLCVYGCSEAPAFKTWRWR